LASNPHNKIQSKRLAEIEHTTNLASADAFKTRARRIERSVQQLSLGKRRACCVNVYEYMLCRIYGDARYQTRHGGGKLTKKQDL